MLWFYLNYLDNSFLNRLLLFEKILKFNVSNYLSFRLEVEVFFQVQSPLALACGSICLRICLFLVVLEIFLQYIQWFKSWCILVSSLWWSIDHMLEAEPRCLSGMGFPLIQLMIPNLGYLRLPKNDDHDR